MYFRGGVGVQLGRGPAYFFGFFIVISLIFGPIAFVSDALSKRRRNKTVKQFKSYSGEDFNQNHKKMFENYIKYGLIHLAKMKKNLSGKNTLEFLNKINEKELEVNIDSNEFLQSDKSELGKLVDGTTDSISFRRRTQRLVKDLNLLTENDRGEKAINTEMEKALSKFIDFVVIKQS